MHVWQTILLALFWIDIADKILREGAVSGDNHIDLDPIAILLLGVLTW